MTKEECLQALKDFTHEVLRDYNNTKFDRGCNKHILKSRFQRQHDLLEQLITEHFDNPPLSFEELTEMVGFPVWDDKEKMWFIVSETFKPFAFNVPIYVDALSIKLVNNEYCSLIITNNFECHEKFEENRFYRRLKEELQ